MSHTNTFKRAVVGRQIGLWAELAWGLEMGVGAKHLSLSGMSLTPESWTLNVDLTRPIHLHNKVTLCLLGQWRWMGKPDLGGYVNKATT